MQIKAPIFDQRLRVVIKSLLVVNSILLLLNVLRYPPVLSNGGLSGLAAAILILLLYGYLTLRSPLSVGKLSYASWRSGVYLGLISGLVLSVDLVSGYLLHDTNLSARTSLAAYGIFLLFILACGFIGTWQNGKFAAGLTTALWCVFIALLIWFFVEFAAYTVFSSTTSGAAFIQQEMQADFVRSGERDYQAFALSDFFGAGFFHLLLGLIIAVLLGFVGASGGKIWRKIRSIKP